MSTSFETLLQDNLTQLPMDPGALVKAKVIAVENDFIVVSVGLKSECWVPVGEFKQSPGQQDIPQVGHDVEVMLEWVENGFGETVVSREKAEKAEAWVRLQDSFDEGNIVEGHVLERVRGGFTVELDRLKAFLPGSLVDIRPIKDPGEVEGKTLNLKIVKMDKRRNNIVVSRKAVIIEETAGEREGLLSRIKEGNDITGVVKNLTDYGAFVDLGGIDGLLHITDISWKRVKHPSHVVKVGQTITAKVLSFDKTRHRVSLGLKQMQGDPWAGIEQTYPIGTKLKGSVTNITDYGCFVELENGIEGLVHMSELDWKNKNLHPSKVVQEGEEVDVLVLDISSEKRRISLGIKQCKVNPWEEFTKAFTEGDVLSGAIKSITDFGLFVQLNGDIDGLVHMSDIAWGISGPEAIKQFKKGQEVEVKVLSIDANRGRISLGMKQLQSNPLDGFLSDNPVGSTIKAQVERVADSDVIITMDKAEGIMSLNEFDQEVNQGDTVQAYVCGIDKKRQSIRLSLFEPKAEDQGPAKRSSSGESKATLGDLLKNQISNGRDN